MQFYKIPFRGASLIAQMVKSPSAIQETWVHFLGQWDPLEKGMAPTPVFLPGESHGQRSLVGYSPWDRKESDMTEQLSTACWSKGTFTQNQTPSLAHVTIFNSLTCKPYFTRIFFNSFLLSNSFSSLLSVGPTTRKNWVKKKNTKFDIMLFI